MNTIILIMLLGVFAVKTASLVNDDEVDLEDLNSILFELQNDDEIIKLHVNEKKYDESFDYGGNNLEKGKILETIPVLSKVWSLSVDIKPFGKRSGWTNIITASIINRDRSSYGDRTPAIYFHGWSNKLHICSAVNGNNNYCYTRLEPLPQNLFTNVKVEQKADGKSYVYSIYVNNKLVHHVENKRAEEFWDVVVYASGPTDAKAAAVIKNYKFDNSYNLEKGKVLEIIPVLSKTWSLSVDILPFGNKYLTARTNIIHATRGNDDKSYGDGIPGIWLVGNDLIGRNVLYICSPVNGYKDDCYTASYMRPHAFIAVRVNQFFHTYIKKWFYSIKLNHRIVYQIENRIAEEFSNVTVYASDPWNPKAPALIRNYKFETL